MFKRYRYITTFLTQNKEKIVKSLQAYQADREKLLQRFYYLRWYHSEPIEKAMSHCTSDVNRSLSARIMVTILEGIQNALKELCDFISAIMDQDFKYQEEPQALIEFYTTQVHKVLNTSIVECVHL